MTPPVSVIIPAYNREESLRESVESVLRQTYSDFELLIVDDCSSDNTLKIANAIDDPRVRILQTPENCGASGARNLGAREARGDWLAFQDSDDEWLPTKLEKQMAALAGNSTAIGSYCGLLVLGGLSESGGARMTVNYIPEATYIPDHASLDGDLSTIILRYSLISTQMLVVRRELFETVGGFDEELKALVDWDLCIRLAQKGPFAFIDEPLVLQRFSSNSLTRDREKRRLARYRILEKYGDLLASYPDILVKHYRSLASDERFRGDYQKALMLIKKAGALDPLNLKLLAIRGITQAKALAAGKPNEPRKG